MASIEELSLSDKEEESVPTLVASEESGVQVSNFFSAILFFCFFLPFLFLLMPSAMCSWSP